jgi:predicted MFS family arabinose efflux permease
MARMPTTIPQSVRRRLMLTLFTGQSLFSAAQILSFAVMPIVAAQLGSSEAAAGVPSTVTLLGRAAAAYPVGWLMDRLGRRFGLSTGFILAAGGWLLSAVAIGWSSFTWFLLGTLLAGMGRGIGEQARFAAAEVETVDRRAKAIGLIVFAGTVGAILGPRLLVPSERLAILYGWDATTGPMIVSALLTYVALALNILLLRPDPMHIGKVMAGEDAAPAGDNGRPVRVIFGNWAVRLALLAMVIGQLVMTTIMVITPLYMTKHQYDTDAIAWVLMAHTLGMFGLASVTGWLIDRAGPVAIIAVGGGILLLSALLAPVAATLVTLALALFLLGLGWNFCFIGGSSLLSDALQPQERGRVQGASETLVSLASGLGSLSTGAIYAQGGMTGISLAGLAFAAVLLLATFWFMRMRTRPLAVTGD